MGLKEKLENLMLQEERKKQLESAAEQQRRKSSVEQEERIRVGLEQLEKLAKRELQPLLELVNDVYLGGRGKVGELEKIGHRLIDGDKYWDPEYRVELGLCWGRHKIQWGEAGESLIMELGDNRVVRIRGGSHRSSKEFVKINDRDGRQKLEDSVYKTLTTPRACAWSHQDADHIR